MSTQRRPKWPEKVAMSPNLRGMSTDRLLEIQKSMRSNFLTFIPEEACGYIFEFDFRDIEYELEYRRIMLETRAY